MNSDKAALDDLHFRPITEADTDFIYRVYASTRTEELAATGWSEEQIGAFLNMQFRLQHSQYMRNYLNASFDIILFGEEQIGRLYVERNKDEMRIIDIALLPEFRRKGIGGRILRGLVEEADTQKKMMSLHVEMNNPILPFYMKLGFREIELKGIYWYMERK